MQQSLRPALVLCTFRLFYHRLPFGKQAYMLLRGLLKNLFIPPTSLLLLLFIAWLGWRRWPRFSRALLGVSLLLLWVLSLPVVGGGLLGLLEAKYQPVTADPERLREAQAIVVLGGGRNPDAREYDGDTVNGRSLARLRYGALLHRESGLPVLLTGGRVHQRDRISEAQLMADVMKKEFHLPVAWQEDDSRTTAENARNSAEILRRQQIGTVLLVTHAWHMPRAAGAFASEGLEVIPAPMGFTDVEQGNLLNWLPSPAALQSSYFALHEWLGGLVYQWQQEGE